MPQMQTTFSGDQQSATAARASASDRLFKNPGGLTWYRSDWSSPLGKFNELNAAVKSSLVGDHWVEWNWIEIPELLLERSAALLLLQGMPLSQLLIPNHMVGYTLDPAVGELRDQLAHLILRVDPWEVWRPTPRLTGLVLAKLGEVPRGVTPTELLAALASDSAPA